GLHSIQKYDKNKFIFLKGAPWWFCQEWKQLGKVGVMRISAAQINPIIGDVEGNCKKVIAALRRSKEKRVDVVVFPELSLSGYPPEDLLLDGAFIDALYQQLEIIRPETKGLFVTLGLPR